MSLYSMFQSPGPSGFGYGSTAEEVTAGLSLEGKTVLITGCSSGLGLEAARVLLLRGAQVLGTARTAAKAEAALAPFSGRKVPLACELSDPKSVRACVDAVKRGGFTLDALIANAGIMAPPKLEQAFGHEVQFFTNHIGHFILVTGLLGQLSEAGRVVILTSALHTRAPKEGIEFDNLSGEKGYDGWRAYAQSKFANLLFAKELARRFEGSSKTANAVHPGVIHTGLSRKMNPIYGALMSTIGKLGLKTLAQGAATEVYVAAHPSAAALNGKYFADSNVAPSRADGDDVALAKALWDRSEAIVASL